MILRAGGPLLSAAGVTGSIVISSVVDFPALIVTDPPTSGPHHTGRTTIALRGFVGQADSQAPQPLHFCGSICTCSE